LGLPISIELIKHVLKVGIYLGFRIIKLHVRSSATFIRQPSFSNIPQ
jgi:ABC-type uncharacterized transport system permease subunit